MNLKADSAGLQSMYSNTENDRNGADLMLYMGFIGAGYSSGGGIAYLAVVCENGYDKYKQVSITMVKVSRQWENSLLMRWVIIWEWPMILLHNTVGMELRVQVALVILKVS